MTEKARAQLSLLNVYLHDIATGTWIASIALVTLVHFRTRGPEWAGAAPFVPALVGELAAVAWASLATVLATGVVRMITWKVLGWGGAAALDHDEFLKVKHAVLGLAFGGGTAWLVTILRAR